MLIAFAKYNPERLILKCANEKSIFIFASEFNTTFEDFIYVFLA